MGDCIGEEVRWANVTPSQPASQPAMQPASHRLPGLAGPGGWILDSFLAGWLAGWLEFGQSTAPAAIGGARGGPCRTPSTAKGRPQVSGARVLGGPMASFIADLVGGAQGGIAGAYASHPFDVCSVAVMRGEASNGFAALIKRVKTEGLLGLWRGVPLNALFNAVNKSIYFMLYAWLTKLYKTRWGQVASGPNMLIGYFSQLGALPFFCPFYTTFLSSLKAEFVGKGALQIVSVRAC